MLESMEIRKQDAVERAMDHSRDDLPRLKRLAAANKHSWLPARSATLQLFLACRRSLAISRRFSRAIRCMFEDCSLSFRVLHD